MRKIYAGPALALLAACDAGGEAEKAAPTSPASVEAPAEGKAEEGRMSIKGPGFDLKINIPEGMQTDAQANDGLLYPGAKMSGMHIEAGPAKGNAGAASGVELRFSSPDPVEKLAAWYRDPARKGTFNVASASREGDAVLIAGTQKGDGDPFSLRLTPAGGGGTEGRLTLSDRR